METERQHRVHERADEDAERHLVADVADEVPHHARPELLRRQRQRQDRDGEHHADDRDDRGGDGDQDLALGVGAPRADPVRQRQVVVVRRQVDLERDDEQQDRDHDQDARDDPEGRPQLLPAPARQLAPVLVDPRRLRDDHLVDLAHEAPLGSRTGPPPARRDTRSVHGEGESAVGHGRGVSRRRPVFPAHPAVASTNASPPPPAAPTGRPSDRTTERPDDRATGRPDDRATERPNGTTNPNPLSPTRPATQRRPGAPWRRPPSARRRPAASGPAA